MRDWKAAIFWAVMIWLVPFVIAYFFYAPDGTLMIDRGLFRTIMIIIGSAMAAIASVMYYRRVESGFCQEGLQIGLLWMLTCWALDLAILVPMAKMTIPAYFADIGLRYLSILVTTIALGAILEAHTVRLSKRNGKKRK